MRRWKSVSGEAPSSTTATLEARPESIWLIWNARSLGYSVEVPRRKMEFVRGLARRAQVIMLQETRTTSMGDAPCVSARRCIGSSRLGGRSPAAVLVCYFQGTSARSRARPRGVVRLGGRLVVHNF